MRRILLSLLVAILTIVGVVLLGTAVIDFTDADAFGKSLSNMALLIGVVTGGWYYLTHRDV